MQKDPQDLHILIPESCDCIILHGKRDTVDVIEVMKFDIGD